MHFILGIFLVMFVRFAFFYLKSSFNFWLEFRSFRLFEEIWLVDDEFFHIHAKKNTSTILFYYLLYISSFGEKEKFQRTARSKMSSPLTRIFDGNRIVLSRSTGENNTDE